MFSKRQIKALLEVMSADEVRPILTTVLLDEFEGRAVAVATDSYKMAILDLGMAADSPEFVAFKGNLIARASLVTWYKLAAARDTINTQELLEMSLKPEGHMKWPDYKQILKCEGENDGVTKVSFNAGYALTLETLADGVLAYDVSSDHAPMIAKHREHIFVLMPCRVY